MLLHEEALQQCSINDWQKTKDFILGKFTLAKEPLWVQTFWQLSAAFISE